jgi:hypothetical protein
MDRSVVELFVILALNPEKGRVSLNKIHFMYSLTGALFMDYPDRGEITTENKSCYDCRACFSLIRLLVTFYSTA